MNGDNHLALWAGLTALFVNLVAIKLIDAFGGPEGPGWYTVLAAVITAFFVAASIYSKQRWDDEKRRRAEREARRARR